MRLVPEWTDLRGAIVRAFKRNVRFVLVKKTLDARYEHRGFEATVLYALAWIIALLGGIAMDARAIRREVLDDE